MKNIEETIIGTVLYAALPKRYEVFRLVFTSRRIIIASISWRKKSAIWDMFNVFYVASSFPFQGPSINTDRILMNNWQQIKDQNKGKSIVSYDATASDEMLQIGAFGTMLHEIHSVSYSRIKKMIVRGDVLGDCRLTIKTGSLAKLVFLIPDTVVDDLKSLVAKTPLAGRLEA